MGNKKIITFNLIYKFYAMMRKKTEILKYYSEETSLAGTIDYSSCDSAIESIEFDSMEDPTISQEPLLELTIKDSPVNYFGANLDKGVGF